MEKFFTNLIITGNMVTLEYIRGVEVLTQLFSLTLFFPCWLSSLAMCLIEACSDSIKKGGHIGFPTV